MPNTQGTMADLITEVHRWSHSGRFVKNEQKVAELVGRLNELAAPHAVFGVDRFGDMHVTYDRTNWPAGWNPPYINTRVEVVWYYNPVSFEVTCVKSRHGNYVAGARYFVHVSSFSVPAQP